MMIILVNFNKAILGNEAILYFWPGAVSQTVIRTKGDGEIFNGKIDNEKYRA